MIRLRRLALGQLRTSMRTKLRPVENEIGCRQVTADDCKMCTVFIPLEKYTPTKVSAVGFGATDIACIVAGAVVAYPAMKWMWWLSQVIFVWFAMKYCKHQNKNWCNTDITRGEIGGARRAKPSWTSLNYLRTPLKHANSIIFWLLIWLWCFSEDIRRRRLAW